MKGDHPMKTKFELKQRKRGLLLSLFCAGVIATFMGGCAEGPYMTAYDGGYYYPSAYYTRGYYSNPYSYYAPSYYAPRYSSTRYYTRYGTRYYYGGYGY
jgi:hypothetical protein